MKGLGVAALFASAVLLPAGSSAQGEARTGKPANMCQELVAFIRPPAAAPTGSPPPQAATAVQAPAQGAAPAQPQGGTTQQNSGLSGPTAATGPDGCSGASRRQLSTTASRSISSVGRRLGGMEGAGPVAAAGRSSPYAVGDLSTRPPPGRRDR